MLLRLSALERTIHLVYNSLRCRVPSSLSSVLGVEPGVSDENLRRAYRRAAVKWHPDKNTGNIELAEKKFKEIQKVLPIDRNAWRSRLSDKNPPPGRRSVLGKR